ncbi:hypothetical protein BC827DRAFT_1168653 [Russula dissimulans]|nr:hypothetical protein BC827DRAFT_1168653 [Russula dissimulans]
MPCPAFTPPPWLSGFLSYSFLLVVNVILPFVAMTTLYDVATGLEIPLIILSSLASIILIAMLCYKLFMRQWVFNDAKRDRPVLLLVTLIDICSGVAWAISLDREGAFCHRQLPGSVRSCRAAPVAVGLVLAWIAVVVAYCASASADHERKRRRPPPLPIHVSRPIITSPVLIHAGFFSENVINEGRRFGDFTDIPLQGHNKI